MAAAEQSGFEIPDIQERDELVLAIDEPSKQELWTPGSADTAAERAAQVLQRVLGIDAGWAKDQFVGQLEAMQLTEVPKDLAPIASVTVGSEDNNGRVIKPTHVVNGHDQLTTLKGGESIPLSFVWPEMYANRSAAWWNKTLPQGESQLVEAPFRIVLADMALRGTRKKWEEQQNELLYTATSHQSGVTAIEGSTPLDWMMMDADALIVGNDRPNGVTRFAQHPKDRSGAPGDCGPGAVVDAAQAHLFGWRGVADSGYGFRAVVRFIPATGRFCASRRACGRFR